MDLANRQGNTRAAHFSLYPIGYKNAAHTAALIAKGPASVIKTGFAESQQHNLYPMLHPQRNGFG